MSNSRPQIIVGITGASGIQYSSTLLNELSKVDIETHLVVSKAARLTIQHESDVSFQDLSAQADVTHPIGDFAANISSGSFQTMGMIIAPCSARTLAEIASGVGTTLLTRAADVTLKERRPLVLLVRESPLSLIHLRNMETVTEAGGIISLPTPAFYNRPKSVQDIVDDGVGRMLSIFNIDSALSTQWDPQRGG